MAKKARTPNAAFMKPMTPSEKLGVVVGTKPIPRTEVTKKLWAYIKRHGLQDKKNKRMIKADDALRPVFGGKSMVNMFEMTKLVNKHLS
jgi:chromatin remodeling complex protein RSC6